MSPDDKINELRQQGNLKKMGNFGFQSLMYVNFVIKKKYRVDLTAKVMKISKDTLYRYIRGEMIIPPDRIVDLIRATGDIEFLEFFCDALDFVPIPKIKEKRTAKTLSQMIKVMQLAIDLKEEE